PLTAIPCDIVSLQETATNWGTTAPTTSNTIAVTEAPPVNPLPPSISGDAEPDALLTATPRTRTVADLVTGEWYYNGAATGDHSLTRSFPSMAVPGDFAFYKETATNEGGSTEASSNTITITEEYDDSAMTVPDADLWVVLSSGTWQG